jgi:AraC-like DNA-binding protein
VFRSALVEIACWRCLRDDARLRAERAHAWPALTFVHEGAYLLHSEGRTALMDPGHVSFQGLGTPYATTHAYGVGDRGMTVAVHPDVWAEIAPGARGFGVRLRPPEHALRDLQLALRLSVARDDEALAIEEEALALVSAALHEPAPRLEPGSSARSRGLHRDLAERARVILVRRYREPLRLSEVADALRVSPFHLSRVFRRETGVALHRYLNRLRLLAGLLEAREAAGFSQLALELGFSSHSHFTAAFTREFGVPPRAARQAMAEA